jgi:ketosteroid isomerase-like protein
MNQEHDKSIENEIIQIEREIFAAIKGRDTKKLDQLLSDDFIYRNPMEGDRSRSEFLAAIESLPVEILSVWSEDMKVSLFADVVVMSGTQKAKTLNDEGKEEISAAAFVDVFVKHQEKWKLVWAHGVDLPSVPNRTGEPSSPNCVIPTSPSDGIPQ